MDWLKLFALLVAVASTLVTAEGPKKKIRIHLPQKVKHIYHHKKIYITNHPAPSQYAPAYLPGVKGAVALPSNVGRPSVANLVPINSLELFDESRRLPRVTPAASKLLPLYHARGHYGPNHSEWDEQEFDLNSPPEPTDYAPSAADYSGPPPISPNNPSPANHSSKRLKIVKVNEPRKKVIRKIKPKRVYVRGRPQLQSPPIAADDEHPVSMFHEQFYSDIDDSGTIRKIRKPQRVEKIIDGDTEHIHTYSEEHIHKVVFDDDAKVTGVMGVNPIGSMSALSASHPLIPLKNAQTLVAIPSDIADLAVVGSMGTPSHLEYASYNPQDVTHDHIFHDHGELPSGIDVTKDTLRLPPKVSYNSHGLRIGSGGPKKPNKFPNVYPRPTNPTRDFSYYESIYTSPKYKSKKYPKPTLPTTYETSNSYESNFSDLRPIPAFRFKEKKKSKPRYSPNRENIYGGKPQLISNFQPQQASVPSPFSVSSTIVHNYEPKNYGDFRTSQSTPLSIYTKFRDPLVDFKDSFSNEYNDHDAFASTLNIFTSEDKDDSSGKKSVSTQNISFGGKDHQTFVDHLAAASSNTEVASEVAPTAMDTHEYGSDSDSMTPTPYTIKETSPAHEYYSAMALKALHGDQTETSDDNLHYTDPPSQSTMPEEEMPLSTTTSTPKLYKIQSTDAVIPIHEFFPESTPKVKQWEKQIFPKGGQTRQRLNASYKDHSKNVHPTSGLRETNGSSSGKGSLKYGDKI